MTILYVLVPLAMLCGIGAVMAFLWAVRSGQLDDLETPALRILTDDDTGDTPADCRRGPASPGPGSTANR